MLKFDLEIILLQKIFYSIYSNLSHTYYISHIIHITIAHHYHEINNYLLENMRININSL